MTGIHRARGSLTGDFSCNPDREMACQALCMALLVRGRTVLEDFGATPGIEAFMARLERLGLAMEPHGQQWRLEGTGFGYKTPTDWEGDVDDEQSMVLLLTLLSKDLDSVFAWKLTDEESKGKLVELLSRYFLVDWKEGGDSLLQWQFRSGFPMVRPTPMGDIPYLMRNRMLLGHLISDGSWRCEEKIQVRDQFSRLMAYFGVPLSLEITGGEEMDELARRMARAQGLKVERKCVTSLQTVKVLTARDYFVPGDTTEGAAVALAASLCPGSSVQIRNVSLNAGRAGFFAALKRLGANVDITSRRERYGDLFGNLTVQTAKKFAGRRLAADVLANSTEEVPLLAVAACFAEGETILRVPEHLAPALRGRYELLAENLRRAGVDVGVYEEGLVLRGREECDAASFNCHGDPLLAIALLVLARSASGVSTLEGLECARKTFPGLVEYLLQGTSV